MNPGKAVLALAAVVVLLGLSTAPAQAGESLFQTTFGNDFFNTDPPCPARNIPTFEAIAPIPSIFDPFEDDLVPVFCQIGAFKKGNGVNKLKGTYTSELVVVDNTTGLTQMFPIDSGKFQTDENGFDNFDFEIPTELFADGFESGDVSAWSYTRSDFTKKKKADNARLQCNTSSSRSN